jgi:predicted Rossmann fold flavoprotein
MSNVDGSTACDVAVVGAGAAGLAAAIAAGQRGKPAGTRRIMLLDGARTIGAKILIFGGGRCNVTHYKVTPADFFGNRRIIKNVLAAFTVPDAIVWFASLGVELKREETGKLFPVTDQARTILTALVRRCRELHVTILPNHRVISIEQSSTQDHAFVLHHLHGTIWAKKVILATGGRSVPKSGSDGFGYELARRLGHHVSPTAPALVLLVLNDTIFHGTLAGLSHEVELVTMVKGRSVDRRTGSLLWAHFGISGPVVMDASRFWCLAQQAGEPVALYGNFLSGRTSEQAQQWFMEQAHAHPRGSLAKTLSQQLPERFAEAFCTVAGCDPQRPVAQTPREDRRRLLADLIRFRFAITRDRGWNYAEVTAGGVPLEEINFRTMESKLVRGLYLVGEILDCDGRIGGFNFHWAWATGFLAGKSAASS